MSLFRVVQESLTNVYRHSASKTATVRLLHSPDQVTLEVEDQGRGMPSELLSNSEAKGVALGVGILGMQGRLAQLGGKLEIESSNQGTTVKAIVPVVAENSIVRAAST